MEARLLKLTNLMQQICDLEERGFQQQYRGVFMMAAGFLASEEIQSALSIEPKMGERTDPSVTRKLANTADFKFGHLVELDPNSPHPLEGHAFFLKNSDNRPYVVIGRGTDCDITIPDRSVSEEHCRLEIAADGVIVVDLSSKNGTRVNHERVAPYKPMKLADEDVLSVGRYTFHILGSVTLYRLLTS